MSWVKHADGYKPSSAKSYEEFVKEHKIVPGLEGMKAEQYEPLLAQLGPTVVREMFAMKDQMDPLAYQRYIETLIGLHIPTNQMDEFIKRLEIAYNSLTGQ